MKKSKGFQEEEDEEKKNHRKRLFLIVLSNVKEFNIFFLFLQ